MTEFVRRNIIKISATFIPKSGNAQASAAEVAVYYENTSGAMQRDVLAMSLDTDGVTWFALWDSTLTLGGVVQWAARSVGLVVGSDEGSFTIRANKANTST